MSEKYQRRLSHTSITTYMTCPRKYYWRNVKRIPFRQTTSLVMGNIMHALLEQFLNVRLRDNGINKNNYEKTLFTYADKLFEETMSRENVRFGKPEPCYQTQLMNVCENEDEYNEIIEECKRELYIYVTDTVRQIDAVMQYTDSLSDAIKALAPRKAELELKTDKLVAYIDAVCEIGDNEIMLVDYKTSKNKRARFKDNKYFDGITTMFDKGYVYQLLLYCYLYNKIYGVKPTAIVVRYLRTGKELCVPLQVLTDYGYVDYNNVNQQIEDLVNNIYSKTESKNINDYPMNIKNTFELNGIKFDNPFCTCKLSRFSDKDWCEYAQQCNECINNGDTNIV